MYFKAEKLTCVCDFRTVLVSGVVFVNFLTFSHTTLEQHNFSVETIKYQQQHSQCPHMTTEDTTVEMETTETGTEITGEIVMIETGAGGIPLQTILRRIR